MMLDLRPTFTVDGASYAHQGTGIAITGTSG